ncbi:MAG: hypothetical protein HQ502_06975 [Alphaproteobacteria bacterium]|nr:hypothetical protein [Alphaproteobacteria bacterium]
MAKRLAIALTNLVRMSRTSHAGLSEYINPYNKLLWSKGGMPGYLFPKIQG